MCTALILAQPPTLTVDEAIAIAVQNNHDLRVAKNNTKIAEVDASLLNSGYLPTLSAQGGISYSNENQNVLLNDGNAANLDGAVTETYNASVTAEYMIFDGLVRKFTQDSNEANFELAQLQERQQIENTIIGIYEQFFQVAYQRQVVINLKRNITNSADRLDRAQRNLKYGQGTQLEVLNAQVDLSNDSISHREALRDLKNAKRNLNLLLGREVRTDFTTDTTVVLAKPLQETEVIEMAEQSNIQIILAAQNILLSEIDLKINKAQFLPKVSGSGSYRWNESQNPPTSFALNTEAYGVNLGLNLSWNLFNGSNSARIKKAKIAKQTRAIELAEVSVQLETEVLNAYETYGLAQYQVRAAQKNWETNQRNFERTQKQYRFGQITAIEFRQAQINLFNAANNAARSRYDLKIAEINLLQLMGTLI
ncbi:MAG: TolC family protein [Bacteroidota bacterium]